MYCVYILHSEKLNRFYTGSTSNFDNRMVFHENSEARKFTAKAEDWNLFHKINCISKTQALALERHIKSMKSKTYIANLKKYPDIQLKLLEKFKSIC